MKSMAKIKRIIIFPIVLLRRLGTSIRRILRAYRKIMGVREIIGALDEAHDMYLRYDRSDNDEDAFRYKVRRDTIQEIIDTNIYGDTKRKTE